MSTSADCVRHPRACVRIPALCRKNHSRSWAFRKSHVPVNPSMLKTHSPYAWFVLAVMEEKRTHHICTGMSQERRSHECYVQNSCIWDTNWNTTKSYTFTRARYLIMCTLTFRMQIQLLISIHLLPSTTAAWEPALPAEQETTEPRLAR